LSVLSAGLERRRFTELTLTLAITRFKLRYFGNVLGYFWTLAKPLLLFGVLYLAFTEIIRFGGSIAHYPAYLITAIVLFTYFQEATGGAVSSLVDNSSLVQKIPMPLLAIPLSISLNAAFNLALNLIAVMVFVIASGVEVRWSWLELPALLAVLIVLSTAVATILAYLYVRFRDMGPIWEVISQLLFWGTPVVYTIDFVRNDLLRHVMMMNPLAVIETEMRHAVIDSSAPTAATAIGGAAWLLVPTGIVAAIVGLSVLLHRRAAPRIAELV
jgi:ABC-2 type transport system permease protein